MGNEEIQPTEDPGQPEAAGRSLRGDGPGDALPSRETPQSILTEVMERGRFSEEKRRIYVQRMSRALLVEVAEIMRLYGLTDKAEREKT